MLTRTDSGSGTLLIDAIELSGSYMLGEDPGGQETFTGEEVSRVIFDFDMTCGAETNLVKGVNPRKQKACGLSITFPLDAETLKSASGMSYRTRLAGLDTDTTIAFPASRFMVNGHAIKEYGSGAFPAEKGYLGPFDIPLEYLKDGTNTFTFSTDYIGGNTSKWRIFSFHRFDLKPVPPGMMVTFY